MTFHHVTLNRATVNRQFVGEQFIVATVSTEGKQTVIYHYFEWPTLNRKSTKMVAECRTTLWRCQKFYIIIIIIYLVESRRHAIVVATDTQESQG